MRLLAGLLVVACCGCSLRSTGETDPFIGANPYAYGIVPPEDHPPHQWTTFVSVRGQPEPVPAEWVSTPEGMYAHNIVLPNPVPKDSGYRRSMSAKDYFLHLCEKEAGEFVYRKVEDVEGVLFMRPLFQPTDQDLRDRFKLEAPGLLSGYQLWGSRFSMRAAPFVRPGDHRYTFYEEPVPDASSLTPTGKFLRGWERGPRSIEVQNVETSDSALSKFGVTWRGLIHRESRQRAISAEEILVVDLKTGELLGALRRFFLTGRTPDTPQGIWWLNAARCPKFVSQDAAAGTEHIEKFISTVLVPAKRLDREEKK